MKLLFSLLAFIYVSVFSYPAYSMVFVPTDGDVDFTLQGELADESAFFAFVTPDGIAEDGTLVGGAVALPAQLTPLAGQAAVFDFPAVFAEAADPVGFNVGLFYTGHWENPTSIEFLGGDTYRFDWAPEDWGGESATLLMSDIALVPIPATVWLFASGLLGFTVLARKPIV